LDDERETESDLLLRVRSGDLDAFAELTERNRGSALVVARSIVDQASAEDVVADSIERLLLVLKRGEGPTYSVRPYFLQMVRNRAIDYRRRAVELPMDPAEAKPVVAAVPEEADATLVRSAFEALPERWQAALWLGVVESRSHAEIGRELDVAEGAASQLLHRAREGLRQSYLDAQLGTGDECTRLSGLLGRYVRGRCSSRDARTVNAHLAGCECCRSALSRTRQLNARIGSALAVGILGGVGLELLRRPAGAMAAELTPQAARASKVMRAAGKARHLVGLVAGLAVTAGLVVGIPANAGGGVQPDAIMAPLPALASFSPASTPSPTPTPSATPTPAPTATTAKPKPKSRPKPTPSAATPSQCSEGCPVDPEPSPEPPRETPSPVATETPSADPSPQQGSTVKPVA
jgi:RNA polymerase sigma factor (sigma-70 family)